MDKPATVDSLVGRLLDGRYLVGERIARGGMATVYEATDLRLDRVVALKVLPSALADDEEFHKRFAREARSAARLTHPNVVAVYDQSEDDGVLFLAMEYIDGRHTLRDVIRSEAPLPPARALALLEEVLKAISAAHQSGIVHRDIKPENVLIDPRGQVKVADFGLARAISSATSATATGGLLLGTVSYLPPELVTTGTADARSDVYSLGVVAFELLTGRKPHTGETPIQVAYKHVHEDICAPSDLVDGIPPYVDAFVIGATRRDRTQRPADAHVMLRQLGRVRSAMICGVVDDDELTSDLTVAMSGRSSGDRVAEAGASARRSPSARPPSGVDRDEVFNFAMYDDFPADTAAERPERTLLVSESRHQAPSGPSDDGLAETSEPAAGDHRHFGSTRLKDPPERAQLPRRRRKRGWIAFLLVVLLAAGAGVAGWYYGIGRFEATPNVVSLNEAAARDVVESKGLSFKVASTAFSETVRPGHVISTSPREGEKIVSDGVVLAVVSRGPERYDMPNLENMSESKAVQTVRENSLTVGKLNRSWNEEVPVGEVVSFEPQPGVELKPGTKVSLVVSKGPEPLQVTDLSGQAADTATQTLKSLGLKVKIEERYDDRAAEGVVLSQTPSRGTRYAGDTVRLVVSLGPRLVEVPNVYSFGTGDATATLENLGFTVETERADPYFGLGFVVGQSVGADELAPFGSTITLTVV